MIKPIKKFLKGLKKHKTLQEQIPQGQMGMSFGDDAPIELSEKHFVVGNNTKKQGWFIKKK